MADRHPYEHVLSSKAAAFLVSLFSHNANQYLIMEIEKTQADLDAFQAKQVMNWVGSICLILLIVSLILFWTDTIDLKKMAIGAALPVTLYFFARHQAQLKLPQRKGNMAKGRSHMPLIGLTVLFMSAELLLTYFLLEKFAELVNLDRGSELLRFTFDLGVKLFLGYRAFRWIIASFDRTVNGKEIAQLEVEGRFIKIGSNLLPSPIWGVPKLSPFSDWPKVKVEKIKNQIIQLTHLDVMKALGQPLEKHGENGLIVVAEGITPRVLKFRATFSIGDTRAYKIAENPQDQLPRLIYDVLQDVIDETVEGSSVEKIKPIAGAALEKMIGSLSHAALRVGYLCESAEMSIGYPKAIVDAITNAEKELIETKNVATATRILMNSGMTRERAELAALAILGKADMKIMHVAGRPGSGGKSASGNFDYTATMLAMCGEHDNQDESAQDHDCS